MRSVAYEMVEPRAPLRWVERELDLPGVDEVLIEVVGCGLCHTDLGFLDDGVRTRHPMPLVLGHEISGFVREAGANHQDLVGQAVVVPAVLPCGECAECEAGRPMICSKQVMPGNDRHGGFASHVVLPAKHLAVVPDVTDADAVLPGGTGATLRHLAVIADAVSTPWAALVRAGVKEGDVVVVVGMGGVGGFAVQLAAAVGAHVIGLDVDPAKLETGTARGAALCLDPSTMSPRDLRKQVRGWAKENGAPLTRWIILECSGSAAGQRTAFGMLVHGATLGVVGYTMDKIELRLSNLMAFDASAIGTWGCDPALYPELVQMVLDGKLDLTPWTELRPLKQLPETLDDVRSHKVSRRVVHTP